VEGKGGERESEREREKGKWRRGGGMTKRVGENNKKKRTERKKTNNKKRKIEKKTGRETERDTVCASSSCESLSLVQCPFALSLSLKVETDFSSLVNSRNSALHPGFDSIRFDCLFSFMTSLPLTTNHHHPPPCLCPVGTHTHTHTLTSPIFNSQVN
jgi:hypothetical protein